MVFLINETYSIPCSTLQMIIQVTITQPTTKKAETLKKKTLSSIKFEIKNMPQKLSVLLRYKMITI